MKQKLLHVQKISVGRVFTREQFAFFNQRGTNLLEEGSAAFAACRTYIAPHYTALCGRIEKARVYSGDLRKQRILSFAAAFPEVRCVKVCRIDAVTLRVRGKQPQGPYLPGYSLQSLLCLERSDRILREHLNLFGVAFYRHRFRHQQDHQVLLYARPVHSRGSYHCFHINTLSIEGNDAQHRFSRIVRDMFGSRDIVFNVERCSLGRDHLSRGLVQYFPHLIRTHRTTDARQNAVNRRLFTGKVLALLVAEIKGAVGDLL